MENVIKIPLRLETRELRDLIAGKEVCILILDKVTLEYREIVLHLCDVDLDQIQIAIKDALDAASKRLDSG